MEKVIGFLKGISTRTWIIIAIIVILIIVIIIYIKNKSVPEKPMVLLNAGISPQSVFPLKYGSRGDEVKVIQTYLNTKGESLVVDGIWGPLTDAAVLKVIKVSSVDSTLFATLK